jgi:hypothetical protein
MTDDDFDSSGDEPDLLVLATPAQEKEDGRVPSPLQAIRAECLLCCNGSVEEVRLCPATSCTLWLLRFGRRLPDAPRSIVGAIRTRCLDCSGGSRSDVASCAFTGCSLHPFRSGTNPNRSRKG